MKLRNLALVSVVVAATACGKAPTGAAASVTVSVPASVGGEPAASAGDVAKELGVVLYPGMETLTGVNHVPGGPTTADFKSADAPDKIAAFYRQQLSKKFNDGIQFQESPVGDGMIRMQAGNESQNITVVIRPNDTGSIVGIQVLGTTH